MDHGDAPKRLCCVCGRQVVTKAMKMKHLCVDFKEQLMEVFQVAAASDNLDVHPQFFCHSCS